MTDNEITAKLKEALAEDDKTKVLVGSLLITEMFVDKLSIITQLKIHLKLIESILKTAPSKELRQVIMDHIISEVMKMQETYQKEL